LGGGGGVCVGGGILCALGVVDWGGFLGCRDWSARGPSGGQMPPGEDIPDSRSTLEKKKKNVKTHDAAPKNARKKERIGALAEKKGEEKDCLFVHGRERRQRKRKDLKARGGGGITDSMRRRLKSVTREKGAERSQRARPCSRKGVSNEGNTLTNRGAGCRETESFFRGRKNEPVGRSG